AAHFSGDDASARAFLTDALALRGLASRSADGRPGSGSFAAPDLDALAAAPAVGDAGGAHVPLSALAPAFDRAGRREDMERLYVRKIDLLEATQDLEGAALAHNNLANLRRLAGRYDLALRGYRRA